MPYRKKLNTARFAVRCVKKYIRKKALLFFAFAAVLASKILPVRRIIRILYKKRYHLLFHISGKCNYNCIYCYADYEKERFTFEKWSDIAWNFYSFGVRDIGILGGEPLLFPKIDKFIIRLREIGYGKIYLYTNGSRLNGEMLKFLAKNNVSLFVKFEINPFVYKELASSPNADLDIVRENILQAYECGCEVFTFTVIHKKNYISLKEIVKASFEIGAYPVFERYIPNGASGFLTLSDGEYRKALKSLEDIFKNISCFGLDILNVKNLTFCGCYDNILSISIDGNIYPCPYSNKYLLGNVEDMSPKEIADRYKALKKGIWIDDRLYRRCYTYEKIGGNGSVYENAYLEKLFYIMANFYTISEARRICSV